MLFFFSFFSHGKRRRCDHLLIIMSEDVLIQILLYLPVISLLRFKSVCKSWRSIIEAPFFIHLHATTTKSGGGGGSSSGFLFFRYDEEEEEEMKRNIFTLSGDKFEVFEDLGRPSVEFEEVTVVWASERKNFYDAIIMVGCCNGIICLLDHFSRSIALWNPAIKQSRILPKPSNLLTTDHYNHLDSHPSYNNDFAGFGIDVKTKKNDYKVLLIASLEPLFPLSTYDGGYSSILLADKTKYPFARSVHVYSLSTDSWKCIDANLSVAHPDLDVDTSDSPRHLNGRCFFMAKYYIEVEVEEEEEEEEDNNNSKVHVMPLIISFDFTQEIFRTIELPYTRRTKYFDYVGLLLFGEKIALNLVIGSFDEFDIWVLNEQQGVMEEESWTKFYTFGTYERYYTPRCIVDNGEFAIMYGYDQEDPNCQDYSMKLQLLNLSTGETNDLLCDCERMMSQVHVYKPSLVPISGNCATVDKPICGV